MKINMLLCFTLLLALFGSAEALSATPLDECISVCEANTCEEDGSHTTGTNQMLTCTNACFMRHIGASNSECLGHCDRHSRSGCFLKVNDVNFNMCGVVSGSPCFHGNHVSVSDCELGCNSYSEAREFHKADNEMNLNDARAYCEGRNQKLVVPKDQAETDKIKSMLGSGDKRAWVGINQNSGIWASDDSNFQLNWQNWKAGEGTDGRGASAGAAMVWQSGWTGEWYDMGNDGRTHAVVCVDSVSIMAPYLFDGICGWGGRIGNLKKGVSQLECETFCLQSQKCQYINYYDGWDNGWCELLDTCNLPFRETETGMIVLHKTSQDTYEAFAFSQCKTSNTQFPGDRTDNPIFGGGGFDMRGTAGACKTKCEDPNTKDSHGRQCVAFEHSSQDPHAVAHCAFAWDCSEIAHWGGGKVYRRRIRKSFSFEARESFCSFTQDSYRDFSTTEGSNAASEQECEEFCSNWDDCVAYSFWNYADPNHGHICMAFKECNNLIPTQSSAKYVVTRSLIPLTEEERCGSCRLRRNWNSMSEDDRKEYIDTVNIARTDERFKSQYDELVMSHGNLPFGDIHGPVEFLAWHRWFIFEFENILRQITPCITVPYWAWEVAGNNWMQDEIWGSAKHQFGRCGSGRVQDGPFSDMILPGTNTRLSRNCGGGLPKLHTMTFLSSTSTNFWSFLNRLQSAHNTIHGAIGGTMQFGSISGMAPEFFLHHNNVDRMWADWQLLSADHKYAQPNRDTPLTGTNGYTVADFTNPHEQAPTGTQETCVEFESQIDGQNIGRRRLSSKATKVNLVVTMSNQLPTDSVFESLLVYTDELSLQINEDFEAASLIFAESQKGGSLSDERAHEIAHEHQENSDWGHYIKERKVDTEYAPDSEAKAFFADIVGITPESVRSALETTHKFEALRTFDSQFEELEKLFNEKIPMPF